MDLRLPITTINGEPIEDLVLALPPLVRALLARLDALVRGEPVGRIVLVPCVLRALLPIWMDLRPQGLDGQPADLRPEQALSLLITMITFLVDQVDEALIQNASRAAA